MSDLCPNCGQHHDTTSCPIPPMAWAGWSPALQEPSTEERIAALEREVAELKRILRGGETSCIAPTAEERLRQALRKGW